VSSDDEGITGGEKWLDVIEDRLKNAEIILVLASPQSIKRPWINFEAGGAWFLKKKVLPLCINGLRPVDLPEPLHSLQARDLQDEDDVRRLFVDISKSAGLRTPRVDANGLVSKLIPSLPPRQFVEKRQEAPESLQVKNKVDSAPILSEPSTVVFSYRTAAAFPGVRGLKWFDNPQKALERLLILLKHPLRFRPRVGKLGKVGGADIEPIWWSRANEHSPIIEFVAISKTKCLMNAQELELDRVAVYRSRAYYRDFVYVETKPEQHIGLYDYSAIDIAEVINSMGYFNEEYGLLGGIPITRAEHDDGAAIINDQVVEAHSAELRVRYLSKFNFVIAADSSPIFSTEFEDTLELHLNGLLKEASNIDELVSDVERLKKSLRHS
jgi:hypothetical protein